MKKFVINRKADLGRRKHIEENFLEKGVLDYEFFEAIEGASFSEDFISRCNTWKAKAIAGRELVANEIACAKSHLAVYKKLGQENIRGAIVFEDDVVVLDDNLESRVQHAVSLISEEQGFILHLGDTSLETAKRYREDLYALERGLGFHAYYINSKGAQEMLESFSEHPKMAIDNMRFLIFNNIIKGYRFSDKLCGVRDDFETTIGHENRTVKGSPARKSIGKISRVFVLRIVLPFERRFRETLF